MNIELHEHLMRVTVDTFKKETDKLKETVAKFEAAREQIDIEYYSMRSALILNGFAQTPTGEWMPPLGKRPDFEGVDLIAAAVAFVEAQRDMLEKARKYEERPK